MGKAFVELELHQFGVRHRIGSAHLDARPFTQRKKTAWKSITIFSGVQPPSSRQILVGLADNGFVS